MGYRAFVSSTFEDLKAHRDHVIKALRNAGIFVDPMEDWTAATHEPKDFSQDRVRSCDLCVLLVGFRRGHVPANGFMSITQLEYQAALKSGMDVLVFMLEEQAPWPRKFDELDKDPEIRPWRKELLEHRGVGFFSHDPRSIKIEPALTRWIAKKSQEGSRSEVPPSPGRFEPQVVAELSMVTRSIGRSPSRGYIMVKARNLSTLPIFIEDWGIIWPSGRINSHHGKHNPPLPYRLEPGESNVWEFETTSLFRNNDNKGLCIGFVDLGTGERVFTKTKGMCPSSL